MVEKCQINYCDLTDCADNRLESKIVTINSKNMLTIKHDQSKDVYLKFCVSCSTSTKILTSKVYLKTVSNKFDQM